MKSRLYLLWNLILGLFVLTRYAEGARATTLILGKSKPEPKIDLVPMDDNNATMAITTPDITILSNDTTSGSNTVAGNLTKLTGVPQIDYIYDPNLPRELNGYNLTDYPFYNAVPEDIDFKCDGLHDGFYASVPHKCQVYHHCLFGTRYDFLCANYTAFDQKTFICHFASEVDCKNSPKYFNRNEALYKAATTTTAAAPVAAGRRPPGNRRRRPYHRKRKPTYEYYDDYEEFQSQDYYEEEDPPPPPPPPAPRRKKRPRPDTNNSNRGNHMEPGKSQPQRHEETDIEEKDVVLPSAPAKSFTDRSKVVSKLKKPTSHAIERENPHRPSKSKESTAYIEREKSHPDQLDSDADYEEKDHRPSGNYKQSSDEQESIEFVPNKSRGTMNHRDNGNHRKNVREEKNGRPTYKKRRPPPSSFEKFDDEEEEEQEEPRPFKNRSKEESRHRELEESEKRLKSNRRGEEDEGDDEEEEDNADYYYNYSRNKNRKKNSGEKQKINRAPQPVYHTDSDYDYDPDDYDHDDDRGLGSGHAGKLEIPYRKRKQEKQHRNLNNERHKQQSSEEDQKGNLDNSETEQDEDQEDGRLLQNQQSRRNPQQQYDTSTDKINENRSQGKERSNNFKAANTQTKTRESLSRNQEKQRSREKSSSGGFRSEEDVDDYDEEESSPPRNQQDSNVKITGKSNPAAMRPKNKSAGIIQRVATAVHKQAKESAEHEEKDDAPVPAPRPAYITEITASGGEKRTNVVSKYGNTGGSSSKKPGSTTDESPIDLKKPQNKKVDHKMTEQSSRNQELPQEEMDYHDEPERETYSSAKTTGAGSDGVGPKNRLKVPLESLNDSKELAPRAPPSAAFPLSSRRRPFLPSRGGSIPRGLLPVGGRKSSTIAKATTEDSNYENDAPRNAQQQQQQERQQDLKSLDRDSVLEFRTKVSASIGVEQPQLTSLSSAIDSVPTDAAGARTRHPLVVQNSREAAKGTTASAPVFLYSQIQSSQEKNNRNGYDQADVLDEFSQPINNFPRYRDHHYASSTGGINMNFHRAAAPTDVSHTVQKEDKKKQETAADSRSSFRVPPSDLGKQAGGSFVPSPQRNSQDEPPPPLRLGPQTFFSENPKFKTTLVVPPGRFVPHSVATTALSAQNARCNAFPHACSSHQVPCAGAGPCNIVKTDQKSDSSRLHNAAMVEENSRKTNRFSYESTGKLKFPKTDDYSGDQDDDDDDGNGEYDESINDALQQFSMLHPRNVPSASVKEVNFPMPNRGVISQPQGFKRRYHQTESSQTPVQQSSLSGNRNVLRQQSYEFESRLAAPSVLYRSYAIPTPAGLAEHQKFNLFYSQIR